MGIEGLNGLVRSLDGLQQALEDLDGDIANVSFDPHDPDNIERAIQQLTQAVDEKVAGYADNEIVRSIADELKEAGRNTIIERASAARLADEEDT